MPGWAVWAPSQQTFSVGMIPVQYWPALARYHANTKCFAGMFVFPHLVGRAPCYRVPSRGLGGRHSHHARVRGTRLDIPFFSTAHRLHMSPSSSSIHSIHPTYPRYPHLQVISCHGSEAPRACPTKRKYSVGYAWLKSRIDLYIVMLLSYGKFYSYDRSNVLIW